MCTELQIIRIRYFNTSNVTIQLLRTAGYAAEDSYFNTSNVTIQRI